MPAYRAGLVTIALTALLMAGACGFDFAPTATTEELLEPTPEPPEPTQVPSGGLLTVDGIPARQVVLWDPELPAEYAATQRMLYRREDVTAWRPVGPLPTQGHIIADPTNPERLFTGDHPPCLREAQPVSFHVSLSGGASWREMPQSRNIRPLTILPENPDVIIGSRCGLAISTDRGRTWETYVPDSGFDLTYLTFTQIGLYGIFTAESGTSHLRRIDLDENGHPSFEEPILTFWGSGAVHAAEDRILVAEPSGVHFSDDGGQTWTFTREGLEDVVASVNPLQTSIPDAELEKGIGLYAVAPHPTDPERIFAGSVRGLYLSEDGGATWGMVSETGDATIRSLEFAMGGTILYATSDQGVFILHNP